MPPVKPMLAKAAAELPDDPGLYYEPKWDGFRCIVFRDGDEVELGSRNDRPLTRYFPELVTALTAALPQRCVLDGEIVIVSEHGLEFDTLQQRLHPAASRVNSWPSKHPRASSHSTCSPSATPTSPTNPSTNAAASSKPFSPQTIRASTSPPSAPTPPSPATGSPASKAPASTASWSKAKTGPTSRTNASWSRSNTNAPPTASSPDSAGTKTEKASAHYFSASSTTTATSTTSASPPASPPPAAPSSSTNSHPYGTSPRQPSLAGLGRAGGRLHRRARCPAPQPVERQAKTSPGRPCAPNSSPKCATNTSERPLPPLGRLVHWRPDRTPESCTYAQLDEVPPLELSAIFRS